MDVHLVDLQRDRQLRDHMDVFSRRRILRQLHHRRAVDDLTFGGRDVLARLAGPLVDLADLALFVHDVVVGVAQALDQAPPLAVDQPLLCGGIADQGVGRGKAVDDDLGNEVGAVPLQRIELQLVEPVPHTLLHGQMVLRARWQERVVLLDWVLEALVLAIGCELALSRKDLNYVLPHGPRVAQGGHRITCGFAQQERHRAHKILARYRPADPAPRLIARPHQPVLRFLF